MKKSARNLFTTIAKMTDVKCFHLSTGLCPAHRKELLKTIRDRLHNNEPTICVSTQLIEAGVDVDFGSVVRFIAGLDSIAQAAGRCNRNGKKTEGRVFIINPVEENIDCLKDIAIGQEKTERVLNDYKDDPEKYGNDRIGPRLLNWYYQNYFFGRQKDMDYPVSDRETGRCDTLLHMLANNPLATGEYKRVNKKSPAIFLRQSFMTAGQLFKAIDAPTRSVIVRYGKKGKDVVNKLCAAFDVGKQFNLLREAQQYSVNLFPHEFRKLREQGALFPVQEETEIFYLDSKYYSDQFGISMEPVNEEEFLHV
jgi:CRISPR-associated endonuclease/helicase Cas3